MRTALLPALVLLLGCPSGLEWDPPPSDDDDSADDDDSSTDDDDATAADDDDATPPDTASYPDEEAFFLLGLGHSWEFEEQLSGGPTVIDDVVWIDVVDRIAGPDFDESLGDDVVIFEFDVDRLESSEGRTHWYGVNGSGALRWYGTEVTQGFDLTHFDGAGETVFKMAPDKEALIGESYDSVWFLPDVAGYDFRAEGATIGTFETEDGVEFDALENDIFEGDDFVGFEVVKGGWGLLSFEINVDGLQTRWTATRCSACPPESGLN